MKKLRALLVWVLTVTMFWQTVYAGTIQTQHPGRDHGQMITIYEPKMQVDTSGVEIIVTVQVDSPVNLTHTVECTLGSENNSAYILFPPLFQSISISGTCAVGEFRFYLPSDAVYGAFGGWLKFIDPLTGIEQLGEVFHVPASSYVRCDHKAVEKLTYDGIEYGCYVQGESGYQEKYDVVHKLMDRYRGTCFECGNVFFRYDNLRDEAHHTPACPCGYTQPGYNAIRSARLLPMGICCAGEDFQLYVVTDAIVDRLTAVNNTGVALNMPWTSYENDDGTKTWTAVYTSNIAAYEGRTWTVTGYNAGNRQIGEKTSEPLIIPRREEAARVTRCQQALKGYVELANFTRKQADSYSKSVGVEYTGITVWQVITRQSLEVTGNLGATAANAATTAWADIPQSVFDMLTGEFGYSAKVIDDMTNTMWRTVVFDMLNEKSVEAPSKTGSTVIKAASDIWSAVDTVLKEFSTSAVEDYKGIQGVMKKTSDAAAAASDAIKRAVDGFPKLKKFEQQATDLQKKSKQYNTLGDIAGWVPNVMNMLTNLCAGCDYWNDAQKLQTQYSQLMEEYDRSAEALIAIINDADNAGNERLRDVALDMLTELADRYTNAQAQFMEDIAGSLMAAGMSGVKTGLVDLTEEVLEEALKKVVGNGLKIAQMATSAFRAVTNFDEVYDTAADLYIIYSMQQSISIPASWDECEYNFRTFQLLARVHAAGCDAAIEFINAHSGLGAGVKELGIESQDAKERAIELLLGEKQSFLDYAAEIERLSVNDAPSAGGGR